MEPTFRRWIVAGLRERRADWKAIIERHGTPVLVLDPDELVGSYRALQTALPYVDWHYAVKAQSHPAVLRRLAEIGACFDVASMAEVHAVLASGADPARCMHTNPHKKRSDIAAAGRAGIRRFVADNRGEIDKFVGVDTGLDSAVEVLVRMATPNPHAGIDLSTKFGAPPAEVELMVKHAVAQGVKVTGLSMHVGSQNQSPQAYADAIAACLTTMDVIEDAVGVPLTTLDLGGGFPVPYRQPVASVGAFAAAIDAALGDRRTTLTVLAEPGRIVSASSMTLVTSVVGVSQRAGSQWLYLDDGVYGSYSNVLTEHITPAVISGVEVFDDHPVDMGMVATTLAGPTCDSLDVIAVDHPMPIGTHGDIVISPMMGAYTSVTASAFNGMPPTPVVALDGRGPTSESHANQ